MGKNKTKLKQYNLVEPRNKVVQQTASEDGINKKYQNNIKILTGQQNKDKARTIT